VDCPGHEAFMSNMISGSAIMDSCVLVIAGNDKIPQPQTYEHLQAVENTNIKEFIILENKLDLINKEDSDRVYNDIELFIKNTKAENARIIPSSIQHNINKEEILKSLVDLPIPNRNINSPAIMIVIRSFDINKAHEEYDNLKGGVVGGSLISGILKIDDIIEIRPGFVVKNNDDTYKYRPIISTVRSLQSDTSKMEYALPGGLIGVCLDVDPSITKSNGMIGQMVGHIGTLPDVYNALKLDYEELKRYDKKDDTFKNNEVLLISVNSMNINCKVVVKKNSKKWIKVQLDKPVCVLKDQKVAIFKNMGSKWQLVAKASISDGIVCDMEQSECETYNELVSKHTNDEIIIDYDIESPTFEYSNYKELLDNIKFKNNNSVYNIQIIPPVIKIINRETIFSNFNQVCNSIKLYDSDVNYADLLFNFITNELSCESQLVNGTITIRGKYKNKVFQQSISKFIKKYLGCMSCLSFKNYLIKENRKLFRICLDCNSKSCVDI
jgi:translation initiation factor 2 gamma subunit (eIF-2gamma)/translation initiation factor 2 beta subunit (eIF-2beta)/eIF-5